MKIAGCSRDRGGVWRHGATKTHAGSLVSSWYIAKDVLDIAERALKLLEEMRTFPGLRTTGFTRDCDALLKEVDAIYPDQAHGVEDKKSGIQWRGDVLDIAESLRIIADEVDKLGGATRALLRG